MIRGPFLAFDAAWFRRWQWLLLLVLQEPLLGRWFRWVLGIRPGDPGYRGEIVALHPHAYVVVTRRPGARRRLSLAGFRPRWVTGPEALTYTADLRTHPKFAKRIYHAFAPFWWTLHAWDWAIADRWVPALSAGFSTLTVYPDAGDPGTNTVDGYARRGTFPGGPVSESFSLIRSNNGTDASGSAGGAAAALYGATTSNQFQELSRGFLLFNTAALGASALITAATLSLYSQEGTTELGSDALHIAGAALASPTSLAASDYSNVSRTSFGSITSGAWTGFSAAYNDISLNASGLAAIALTGVTQFSAQLGWDLNNSFTGAWGSGLRTHFSWLCADASGTSTDPKLVVTYTLSSPSASLSPSSSRSPSASVSPSASISPSRSASASLSPSLSASRSASASTSASVSPSSSLSPSSSRSPSASLSPSVSASASLSPSASASFSPSSSLSPSTSRSPSASLSPSLSVSASRSPSASTSPSASRSPSVSVSASVSPSSSRSPSASISPSSSRSPSTSVSPSVGGPDGLSLLAQFTAGVWTDITGETMAVDGLECTRGISDSGPHGRIADIGTCRFTLKNGPTGDDPTRPNGYYAFASSTCRTGWSIGTPIRVVYTLSGTDHFLWTGKLKTAQPEPGRFARRVVHCTAVDCMYDLHATDVREIVPQVNQTENALIAAIMAALPPSAQPAAVAYDASLDTYPYALDDASTGTNAAALLENVLVSAQGFAYPLGSGILRIENRQARAALTSAHTFAETDLDELDVPGDASGLYNRVRLITHPRQVDAAATTVLFGITTAQLVRAGETVTIWGDYRDPDNTQQLIGGTGQVTPLVSGTDFKANSLEAGGGSDLTANISVAVSAFAASVKFEVTNSGGTDAYLVDAAGTPLLQIRGKGIYDNGPISYEWASEQDYGEHLLEIDLPYQDDGQVAQDRAIFLEAQYHSLMNRVNSIGFAASADPTLLAQAVTRDIGDVITVSETMTGLSAGVDGAIQQITWSFGPAAWMRVRYVLAPRITSTSFVLDDPAYGLLDALDAALGYA